MRVTTSLLAGLLAVIPQCLAASPAQWRGRAIYQVITDRFARADGSTTATCDASMGQYCGGTWRGIIKQLDYIQGMGFDAVWISPITQNIEGQTKYGNAYHGYWQTNLGGVNSHFGTPADLKALSDALHQRKMFLMVDIVVNHNGWNGDANSTDFSTFKPFNKKSQYHTPPCNIDYSNLNNIKGITNCWLATQGVALPDLRTENQDVRKGYQDWIAKLVNDYGIDGLRLDTVMQVEKPFWGAGFNRAANNMFMVGEVNSGDSKFVCGYQGALPGVFDYGTYFPLINAFKSTSGDMSTLVNTINTVKSSCTDPSLLGTFSENHDQPRFAFLNSDIAAAQNLLTYTMLSGGIPVVYQGQEQHYAASGSTNGGNDPYNREALWFSAYNKNAQLYQLVALLNKVRKNAMAMESHWLVGPATVSYHDTTTIAIKKGNLFTVLSNKGSNGDAYTQVMPPGTAQPGQKMTDVLTCATVTANRQGQITVPMGKGQPRVYYPSAQLGGICANGSSSGSRRMRFRRSSGEV